MLLAGGFGPGYRIQMDLRKIIGFTSVSGIGFLLDLTVFTLLTSAGVTIFLSNLLAGICGMSLVYTLSWRRIFTPSDNNFALKLLVYIGYGLCLLTLSSWLLTELTQLAAAVAAALPFTVPVLLVRLAAKAVITVFTLACNYGFSAFLVERLRFSQPRR